MPVLQLSEQQRADWESGLLRLHQQSGELMAVNILRQSDFFALAFSALAGDPLAPRLIEAASTFLNDCAGMHCLICPRELEKPAALVLLYGHRGDTQDCLAMGVCRRCGSQQDQKIKAPIVDALQKVFPDIRELSGAIAAPGRA
jgi:hypothetical protein